MRKKVIIVTGAAGFIGSSITIALSSDYKIIAIDQRMPGDELVATAPDVRWKKLNIADLDSVRPVLQQVKADFEQIDFIIHLAAYYHFGHDWRKEYEQTNIKGTENIVKGAIENGVQRLIFASSIAAMEPPRKGQALSEDSPASDYIPYAKSKSIGEKIIRNHANKLPGIVLRLGGVFSDWCELPPLYSLIKLWTGRGPLCRIIPGKGNSGIPYIHLTDVVQIIKRCLELSDQLASFEIFLAAQHGAVLHSEINSLVQQTCSKQTSIKPIYISPGLAKIGISLKLVLALFTGKSIYERPWMLNYVDRPWVVDTSRTCAKLHWRCSPERGILNRLPGILKRFAVHPSIWIERNVRRNKGNYIYSS